MIRLFEGVSAHDAALKAALAHGPLFYPEQGLDGLKRDEALQIVEWMNTPLGKDVAIVAGPMDGVRQGSSDALLKVIEEPPFSTNHLYLWCEDAGQVSPTILSRVVPEFVHGLSDEDHSHIGRMFIQGDPEFFEVLQQWKGKERALARIVASEIDPHDLQQLQLWCRLRSIISKDIITSTMLVSAWFD